MSRHSVAYQVLVQEAENMNTFLGDLTILADHMISSSDPEMFYIFPRISGIDNNTWIRINRYMSPEEYSACLTNEEQLTLVLLILQSEGVPYEYHIPS